VGARDRDHFRLRLREERERALRELEGLHRGLRDSLTVSVGEVAAYDNHPADVGSETLEREKDLGLTDSPRFVLHQIEEAERRLEEGTYGTCAHCACEIPRERLEAVPWATLCVDCQRQQEERGRAAREYRQRPGRPPEEDVVSAHYGHLRGLRRQGSMYDAEDAWEDVAQYGTSQGPQDDPSMADYDATRRRSPGRPRRRGHLRGSADGRASG
jgi:YteA family regulatory protein